MTTWSSRTTYQGKAINQGTKQILAAANKMLATSHFGGEQGPVTMLQGGYNKGGVAASAGTHDGGGAFDLTPYNWKNRIYVFRLLGAAQWHRTAIKNVWVEHLHTVVCGDGTASAGAKAQVQEYYANGDGLAGSLKDPDWRPDVLPILFHLDGDLSKRYAKVDCHLYNEPTTKGKQTETVKVGDSFTPVAVVKAGEHYWFITADGSCGYEDNFTSTKPKAPPAKSTAKTLTFRTGTMNVIRWRLGRTNPRGVASFQKGPDYYPTRCAGFAKMQEAMSVSICTTTESGQYVDADHLTEALGAGVWNNVLHGDDAGDITQAIHWYNKRAMLDEGRYETGPAREAAYHNTATWVLLRDTATGIIQLQVAHHADYRARGTYTASASDRIREKHTKVLISEAEKIAEAAATKYKVKNIPIIFSGDFNQDKDDFYDGPGKAMGAAGYIDVETVATSKSGPTTTLNSYSSTKTTGRRVDRIFVKKGTEVGAMVTVPGYPNTDHNGFGVAITISND